MKIAEPTKVRTVTVIKFEFDKDPIRYIRAATTEVRVVVLDETMDYVVSAIFGGGLGSGDQEKDDLIWRFESERAKNARLRERLADAESLLRSAQDFTRKMINERDAANARLWKASSK